MLTNMPSIFSRKAILPVCLLLFSMLSVRGLAQPGRPAGPAGATADKVELIHADSLTILNQPDAVVYKLYHNVKLVQKGIVLYCDLAIQNKTTNVIEAYGNVRMVQGDTINVRGDTLYYYGNTRQANVLGNVSLKDRKMTLTTGRLDYDMLTGIAHYPVKGRIVDRENILTSDEGYYDTRSKQFTFQRNVKLLNQPPGKDKTTILADSLLYNSLSKIADFQGPTRIISKDGVLIAKNGQYNTTTRVSNFRQRATVDTEKYTLTGDTLNFDNVNEIGIAHGNVVIVAKKDNTTLTGDHGRYNGKAGVSRMIGHAVVRSPITQGIEKDTLFMRADTLFSFDNKLTKTKKLVGLRNVLVYKSDLQSKCDSLVYDVNDSLLYFYKKPIVWSQNYQMEADSMTAKLKNNRINTMFLKSRAFVISQDTLRNFNQVKGRSITAFFQTLLVPVPAKPLPGKTPARPVSTSATASSPAIAKAGSTSLTEKTNLERVIVEGNGQTIYFAVDEKNRLVGMNRTECSKMNIEFTASRVTRIRNYGRPDMFLTPPKELTDEKKHLDGFRWREKEKPTKAQLLDVTTPAEPKPTDRKDILASAAKQAVANLPATTKALADKLAPALAPVKALVAGKPTVVKPVAPPEPKKPESAKPVEKVTATPPKPTVMPQAVSPAPKPLLPKPIKTSTPALVASTDLKPATKVSVRAATVNKPVKDSAAIDLTTPTPAKPADDSILPKPVADSVRVIPDADSLVVTPIPAAPIEPVIPEVSKPLITPSPAIPAKSDDPTQPAASGTSSNTYRVVPTNRAAKQQNAANQEDLRLKQKAVAAPPPVNGSELEQELNRKPRKQ